MMKTRTIGIGIALVMIAAMAFAQAPAGPRRPGVAALVNYLQLTPDQKAAWLQIHKDTEATIKPLRANALDLTKQLQAAMTATTPDPVAVGKLTLAVRSVRDEIRAERKSSEAKLADVLTPEQKTKFEAFLAAGKAMRHQGN
jgi:Spy/CpxP family protein refolding chaperone